VQYTIGSWELMNVFLKGLKTALDVVERVIDKSPTDYYDLKDKMILVVKNRQLLRAMKDSTSTPQFQQPFQRFSAQRGPPQYNSSNALRTINNIPVPMDLSRGHFPPNQGGQRQWTGQT